MTTDTLNLINRYISGDTTADALGAHIPAGADKAVTISLAGEPVPYSHRSAPGGHRYLPKRQRDVLAMLRLAATEAMQGSPLFDAPVRMAIRVELPVPRSWSKKKTAMALSGELRPGCAPI